MLFKREKMQEVFLTNDVEKYSVVQQALSAEKISFQTKKMNTGSQIHKLGRIGENLSLEIIYYVYVSKEDASKAKYIINQAFIKQ